MSDSTDTIKKAIDDAINRIGESARTREKRSRRFRGFDIFFRSITAILAVASPALVTYSTTPNVGEGFKLAAIFLTGVAGAAATLQAIFALQSSYIRNGLDALDLYDLQGDIEQKAEIAQKVGEEKERYAQLKIVLSEASRRQKEITISKQRTYLQSQKSDQVV